MRSFYKPRHKWIKERYEKCGHLLPEVLERVRSEGPLCSNDFEPRSGVKRSSWWDWKPEKFVLELLFWRGELMISERRGFRRYYDVTERVLPAETDTSLPDSAELGRFLVMRALKAHGLALEQEIQNHIGGTDKTIVSAALQELVDAGNVITVKVERQNKTFFALPEILDSITSVKHNNNTVFFLSPFDNLIILRGRVSWLFDFAYSLECYLPAEKRQYGYFVLPLLWQNKLVARIDAVAERKRKHLRIHKLMFEPDFQQFDEFIPEFCKTLESFTLFNNCKTWQISGISPRKYTSKVRRHLNKSAA